MSRAVSTDPLALFASSLEDLPAGHSKGKFAGRRYGTTVSVSSDRRRWWLLAKELGGPDLISFNFYKLADGKKLALRPCEMPAEKVIAFVLGYEPEIPEARTSGSW